MAKRDNIVLIGMPGAGKSTLGVVLAKMGNRDFLDTDLLIQRRCGATLQEVINAQGPKDFIRIEGQVLSTVDVDTTVISTGGSAVYSEAGMEHLRSIGTIVYLQIEFESLVARLGDLDERGVVFLGGVAENSLDNRAGGSKENGIASGEKVPDDFADTPNSKKATLRALYDERTPLYERFADITVNVDGLSITDAVKKIYLSLGNQTPILH